MADYINREKIQYREIVDYYDEQNMCEIHCDVADKVKIERLPTADVVERSKVDDAIAKIKDGYYGNEEKSETDSERADAFNNGLSYALEILKRNIGE